MRFRTRLALFLVATLAVVQVLTALSVYTFTRRALIAQGKNQLADAAAVFVRQLDDISDHTSERVRILALDYALRVAIAERDHATVISALRNHGRRINATRMLIVELDGTVASDTESATAAERTFAFPELLERATEGSATTVVGRADSGAWMAAVPVLAPVPIAFIVAEIPLDDALLRRLQEISTLPKDIEVAVENGGAWSVIARSSGTISMAAHLPRPGLRLDAEAALVTAGDSEFLMLATPIDRTAQGGPIVAVLGYPLDAALRPYQPVVLAVVTLLGLGLAGALIGAVLIARGVSRPVEALAELARRFGAGDYTPPPPLPQRGEIGKLSSAFASMTRAIAEREERIQHQATHDATTDLLNRPAIETLMRSRLVARPTEQGALLCVGLARLQEIIETVGYELGDRVLRNAGLRLKQAIGTEFVARFSDTSFIIWLPGDDSEAARSTASRIVGLFEEPYQESDVSIDTAAAVGIAAYPQHGTAAGTLTQHAAVALNVAMRTDRSVLFYDPAVDPHRPDRLSLMSELREALDRDELYLAYQPKLDLGIGRIGGAEALVRWNHVKRGNVPPDAFINLAEETGNIGRLTRWAMAKGIDQAASWAKRRLALRLSINLSVRDLDDTNLPKRLSDLLSARSLPPERIMLEITESAIMGEPDAAIAVLRRLADLGVDLAVDDFGIGQSSFAYLRRLPVRELKIDKTFVLNLAESQQDRAIVRSIVELGHRLNYRITAEGVEDEPTLDFLTEVGCDHAQGYFLSRPLAAPAFDAFLGEARWPAKEMRAVS